MKRDPSLKKVMLYGDLGKRFGRVHWMAVGSVGEVTRQALPARCPGFRAYMNERWDQPFQVLVGHEPLDEQGLSSPVGRTEVIKIVPVVAGAKDALTQVILGAALVYAATWTGGASMSYMGAVWGTATASTISAIGMSMALGGIASMLAPSQNANFDPSQGSRDRETFGFSSPTMTTGQGGCVPLLYGKHRASGHVISAGIDAQAWQKGGFGELCTTDDGTRYGNGDTTPWVWAIAP